MELKVGTRLDQHAGSWNGSKTKLHRGTFREKEVYGMMVPIMPVPCVRGGDVCVWWFTARSECCCCLERLQRMKGESPQIRCIR